MDTTGVTSRFDEAISAAHDVVRETLDENVRLDSQLTGVQHPDGSLFHQQQLYFDDYRETPVGASGKFLIEIPVNATLAVRTDVDPSSCTDVWYDRGTLYQKLGETGSIPDDLPGEAEAVEGHSAAFWYRDETDGSVVVATHAYVSGVSCETMVAAEELVALATDA